jgi:hypothetical protein
LAGSCGIIAVAALGTPIGYVFAGRNGVLYAFFFGLLIILFLILAFSFHVTRSKW